jgi:hypothetical protein
VDGEVDPDACITLKPHAKLTGLRLEVRFVLQKEPADHYRFDADEKGLVPVI